PYAGSYIPRQISGAQVNSVTVNAQSQYTETTVTATNHDQGCQIRTAPSIAVTKVCHSATSGTSITFDGTVTNTGDVTLNNIRVYDNQPAANTLVTTIASLAPQASTTYSGSYTTSTSPSTDTVNATGTEAISGGTATASSAPQTCTVPLATRTPGFWATHTAFSNSIWNGADASTRT